MVTWGTSILWNFHSWKLMPNWSYSAFSWVIALPVHAKLQMGLSENGVYSQWHSHLIGIMIINHWVFRGTLHFQTNSRYCSIMFNHLTQKRILLSNLLPKQNPPAAILGFLALKKYRGNPSIISCYIMLYIIYHMFINILIGQNHDFRNPATAKPWVLDMLRHSFTEVPRRAAVPHGHGPHGMETQQVFPALGDAGSMPTTGDIAWPVPWRSAMPGLGLGIWHKWAMGGVVSSQFWGIPWYTYFWPHYSCFFGNFSRTDDGI